jgi:DNA polymerase II small subunit
LGNNITILGNPSCIKVDERRFLLYHGTSINDIVSTIPSLSLEDPEKALKYSIDSRHLALSFGASTPIAPEHEDTLVIDNVPDVLQSGHIHIAGYEKYKGTLLVSCAAWQSQTEYQKKMGVTPTIGEAVMLNLGQLTMEILNFL